MAVNVRYEGVHVHVSQCTVIMPGEEMLLGLV